MQAQIPQEARAKVHSSLFIKTETANQSPSRVGWTNDQMTFMCFLDEISYSQENNVENRVNVPDVQLCTR